MEKNHSTKFPTEAKELGIISFNQAMKSLDCSRSFIYKLIDRENLEVKKIGKKPYLLHEQLLEVINRDH